MPDFTIRADSVDVEQIMRQIRGRIRDKRGVDYTEEQIRELAAAKLERFLDPTGVRSDLLEQFRSRPSLPPGFLYQFEDTTLFDSDKAIVRFFRRLLHPFLKLLFNPNVLSSTLHRQAAFNQYVHAHQPLQFELLHNLVIELTRASIEVKNLKMRLESVQSRLEFNERRARALEAVVQYAPEAAAGGRGRDERRRDPRGENSRGQPPPPRSQQSQATASQRPPQQARPAPLPSQQQARAPQAPVETPVGDVEVAADPATEPQGGIDPITGGDSLRTRRRRRRRGRRSGGEQGMAADAARGAFSDTAVRPGANEAGNVDTDPQAGLKPDADGDRQTDAESSVRPEPRTTDYSGAYTHAGSNAQVDRESGTLVNPGTSDDSRPHAEAGLRPGTTDDSDGGAVPDSGTTRGHDDEQ